MDIARHIDHTALKPEVRDSDIEKLCGEAAEYKFAAVCVNPVFVELAARLLCGTKVEVATVIGFPLGANTAAIKLRETEDAIKNGATEIDIVMSIGKFRSGNFAAVEGEIASIVRICGSRPVKVILETCLLTPEEIAKASKISADAGAAYVKTSTGFGSRGASLDDIRIMKEAVAGRCKIKASGGIRTRNDAIAFIEAGADRIGTSAGVAIVAG